MLCQSVVSLLRCWPREPFLRAEAIPDSGLNRTSSIDLNRRTTQIPQQQGTWTPATWPRVSQLLLSFFEVFLSTMSAPVESPHLAMSPTPLSSPVHASFPLAPKQSTLPITLNWSLVLPMSGSLLSLAFPSSLYNCSRFPRQRALFQPGFSRHSRIQTAPSHKSTSTLSYFCSTGLLTRRESPSCRDVSQLAHPPRRSHP